MAERAGIFAVTGDDVVRSTLDGTKADEPTVLLSGIGARCIAVDPRDPRRIYVGTLDNGLYATDDGGISWREADKGLARSESS
jgi:hypothetical protein